jgi:hypothetical protein
LTRVNGDVVLQVVTKAMNPDRPKRKPAKTKRSLAGSPAAARRGRLAREAAKLDPKTERKLADEGLAADLEEWPEFVAELLMME